MDENRDNVNLNEMTRCCTCNSEEMVCFYEVVSKVLYAHETPIVVQFRLIDGRRSTLVLASIHIVKERSSSTRRQKLHQI